MTNVPELEIESIQSEAQKAAFLYDTLNDACPYPYEHAAVMKYWHQLYGAELIGITNDVIEMKVSNPPKTYQQAFELAKEQMAYCDDIVFQGTMTVERLAKLLVSATSWFFWWD